MQVISLFSGIGGFDLAARKLGWNTVLMCDNDKYCQKILVKNFPNIPVFNDIKDLNYENIKNKTLWNSKQSTIVTGGFPCQPFSRAGKNLGEKDTRFLWDEMLRVIRDIKADWVLAENVYGIITQNGGVVLKKICVSLEAEGYEVQLLLLPAFGVDGCHERERLFIVGKKTAIKKGDLSESFAYTTYERLQSWIKREETSVLQTTREDISDLRLKEYGYPTVSPVCGRNDGVSNRLDRIRVLGNAIVPQVAFNIMKAIDYVERVVGNGN